MGYRRISYWLNEHGYKTPRGHEFKNESIDYKKQDDVSVFGKRLIYDD